MDYLNYFGTSKEQLKDIELIEDELLTRKIISLGILSNILKEKNILLYISTENTYDKIRIKVFKEDYKDVYGLDTLEYLLVSYKAWGLDDIFLNNNSLLFKVALFIDNLIQDEDINELNKPLKVMIDNSNNDWLQVIFNVLKKENLYHLLMKQILNDELEINQQKSELVKI